MVTLADFIRQTGVKKIARRLDVTEQCVRYWAKYKFSPNTDKMSELVEMSKGKLTYKGIVEPFVDAKVKGSKRKN